MMTDFERIVEFVPAYDKRPKKEGDPNYGIGAVRIRFVLKKGKQAVQFLFSTDWYLPKVQTDRLDKLYAAGMPSLGGSFNHRHLMGWDVGYHSPVPMAKDQKPIDENCPYTGGPCYYDGSGLAADRYLDILVEQGSEGVWKALEEYFNEVFV